MAADEVVMLFFAPKWTRKIPLPRKQLIDFARLRVEGGQSRTQDFVVTKEQLRTVTADGQRVFVPGKYTLIVSNGAHNVVEHDILVQ